MRTAFFLVLVAVGTYPQDAPKKRTLAERTEIAGTIVCVGCELEKTAGANADCELHAKHAQGLRDSDGNLWTFLDNTRGHALVTQGRYRDRDVKILGWKYPKARYVEVWKYQTKAATNGSLTTSASTAGGSAGTTRTRTSARAASDDRLTFQ